MLFREIRRKGFDVRLLSIQKMLQIKKISRFFLYVGRIERLKRPRTWISLIILVFVIGTIKNYVDSDYQLFHWHVSPVTPVLPHLLCVLVPYRDRDAELQIFAPHIADFLSSQGISYHIIVLNQSDALRFNRASLINVGWYEADRLGCDYMVMHDVDLLPLNPQLDYSYPGKGIVRHLSSPEYHPKYNYTKFIGGILLLTMSDYKLVNGMSNKYWGWGLEDDEFYLRLRDANLLATLQRPVNLTTDRSNTFRHMHDSKSRKRDVRKYGNQKQMTRQRDRISGLDSVKYHIAGRSLLTFRKGIQPVVSVMNIILECDVNWTNYCKIPT